MATGANPQKVAATRGYGAAVDLEAPDHTAAHERLLQLIEETGRTYIPPFDDPLVIAGQGTVGLEIAEEVPDADLIVCPIGGGGLIAGLATATDTRLVGVEPELSQAFSAGLAAGRASRSTCSRRSPTASRRRSRASSTWPSLVSASSRSCS